MHDFPTYPPGGQLIPTMAEFDADVFAFLRDWHDRHGAESGLDRFYEARLERGFILNHYEIDLANLFAAEWHHFEHYVEVGAGMGELGFLLGALGFSVVAIEGDRKRFAGMAAMQTALSAKYPGVAKVRLVNDFFPKSLPDQDYSRSICFLPCVIANDSPGVEIELSLFPGMRLFGPDIIDMTRLVHYRRTPETQRELVELLRAEGFAEPVYIGAQKGWNDGILAVVRPVG